MLSKENHIIGIKIPGASELRKSGILPAEKTHFVSIRFISLRLSGSSSVTGMNAFRIC
jgi:hypothetical protein